MNGRHGAEPRPTNGHSKPDRLAAQIPAEAATMSLEQAREEIAYVLGLEAYLWGFPLYYYCRTVAETLKVGGIGLNTFRKFSELETAKDRFVVTPNNVTIDAYATFDVTHEPVVVHVPHLDKPRWYLVQIGDMFDEVIMNVGGIKGPRPGDYVITGPDFAGVIPGEMTRVSSRTKMGVAAVRIFVDGDADVDAAVEAQRGFQMVPLSAYLRDGIGYRPPMATPMREPALRGPADLLFFELLGHAMQKYLPAGADTSNALVAAFRGIGLSAANGFDWREIDPTTQRGLSRAATIGEQIVDQAWEALGETTNGWRYVLSGGRSGHDLALRAALSKYMVGGQLATEVLYPNARVDNVDEAFTGEHKYVLRFAVGQLPPVATFWNLSLYGEDMLFVENDFRRYSIGSTTPGLAFESDGSLEIHIQHERPADTSNWLPAPAGSFNLTMRLYGPQRPLLDGTYRLPAVRRAF